MDIHDRLDNLDLILALIICVISAFRFGMNFAQSQFPRVIYLEGQA